MSYVNISEYLPEMASSTTICDEPAVIVQDTNGNYSQYTFKQLDAKSNAIACGLESIGITKGTRTVLMVKPSLDFFALTFALFKVGAIPIMVDPGIGVKNLGKCLKESEPEAFVGIPKAHIARILLGWGKDSIKILVTVGRKAGWRGPVLKDLMKGEDASYDMARTSPEDTAAILFTSGSTGVPKGTIYTHRIFDRQVQVLREVYGIQPGERDMATFPLFALFGPALGMTAIIPYMDASKPVQADPSKIIKAARDFKATNMFASPALINKVGKYGVAHDVKLPSLKRVISAGAPARNEYLERFAQMLEPGVEIFTPYGATEALPVTNIGSNEILNETRILTDSGKGNCVGNPVPGIDLRIITITDKPIERLTDDLILPTGAIGEIIVRGPNVTASYYNREESTALAKIKAPKDDGFYHRMGDLGYIDERGRVWFCGRKSHRVETDKGTTPLYTIPVEAVFNVHPAVFRTAIVGARLRGESVPVLCVELENGVRTGERKKIKEQLLELASKKEYTAPIKTILFHKSFPVDVRHNAKISRETLQEWATRQLS